MGLVCYSTWRGEDSIEKTQQELMEEMAKALGHSGHQLKSILEQLKELDALLDKTQGHRGYNILVGKFNSFKTADTRREMLMIHREALRVFKHTYIDIYYPSLKRRGKRPEKWTPESISSFCHRHRAGRVYCRTAWGKKGLRVGIAEGSNFGGTCTNKGCIPAKTYIESINLYDHIKNARRFGIIAGDATLTLEGLYKRKTRIVTRLAKGIEYLLNQAGVDIYRGYAKFLTENSIQIVDEHIISTSIIIATGSRPKRPDLFNLEGVLTSDEIFDIRQPSHPLSSLWAPA